MEKKEGVYMVDFIKKEFYSGMANEEINEAIEEETYNLFIKESNNVDNGESKEAVHKRDSATVIEGCSESINVAIKDTLVSFTEKPSHKRKLPQKRSLRKQFTRRKRRGKSFKKQLAVFTPEIIVKEEKSFDLKLEDPLSLCDLEEDEQINNEENTKSSAQDSLKQSSVFVVEPESASSNKAAKFLSPPAEIPRVRVQKIVFHKDVRNPGVTLCTPVFSSKNPVVTKPIQYPASKIQTQTSQEVVRQDFVGKWTDFKKSSAGNFDSTDEPMEQASENIPVAAHTTASEVNSALQPGNIPTVPLVAQPGKTPTLSLVAQPRIFLVAQPRNALKFSVVPQSGSTPKTCFVPQPGTIPKVPLMPRPGSILTASCVAQPENVPVVSQATPSNVPVASQDLPGNFPVVSPATLRNISTSSETPTTSRATLFNGIPSYNTGVAAQQPHVVSTTEQLLETVGKKLKEIVPSPWITVLRANGIALCLLNLADIVTIRRSVFFDVSGKVTVGVHGRELPPENPFWENVKEKTVGLREDNIEEFIAHVYRLFMYLRGMEICRAVEEFQPFWKTAENCEIDENRFHEFRFNVCCRSKSCLLLLTNLRIKRCIECAKVWKLLSRRSLVDSKKPESLSVHKPFKYLTSPEKRERFDKAVKELRNLRSANKRLNEKLHQILNPEEGVPADDLSVEAEMADDNSESES